MSKSASAASPAVATKTRKVHTIRPVKARNLTAAVQAAAAYAAYHGEHKPTPSKAAWNKLVQLIGKDSGAAPLRVPYAFGLTLLPVWTAAYKAAKAGHVPGKSITIPEKAKPAVKSSNKSSSKNISKTVPPELQAMIGDIVRDAVDAYVASLG